MRQDCQGLAFSGSGELRNSQWRDKMAADLWHTRRQNRFARSGRERRPAQRDIQRHGLGYCTRGRPAMRSNPGLDDGTTFGVLS